MERIERHGHGFESRGRRPHGALWAQRGGCTVLGPSSREWGCHTVESSSIQVVTYQKYYKAYLSSVAYHFFGGPGAGVTFVKDLDPRVTITIGACRREVCDFGSVRRRLRYAADSRTDRPFM